MAISTVIDAQLRAAEQQRRHRADEYFQQGIRRRRMETDRHGRPVIDVEPIKEDDRGRTSGTAVVGVDTGTDDHGSDPVSDLPSS